MKTRIVFTLLALFILMLASACGGNSNSNSSQGSPSPGTNGKTEVALSNNDQSSPEQITITFSGYRDNPEFKNFYDRYIAANVPTKFPHITTEFIHPTDGGIQQLITAGDIPDVLLSGYAHIPEINSLDLALDLSSLIKQFNVNMAQFDPVGINSVKAYSLEGQMNALPYAMQTFALFYNKDIFDTYGIDYPKDELTWEETIDIAKKVTRTDGSHVSYGLQYSNNNANFARGLQLAMVDPETNKAAFNSDAGLQVLQTLRSIYSIPGNAFQGSLQKKFLAGETAMIPWWTVGTYNQIQDAVNSGNHFNWDLTTYPRFEGMNGVIEPGITVFVVSKTGEHQEEAFNAISYLTSDHDIQSNVARTGYLPVISIENLHDIYGKDIPVLEGKNVAGVLKGTLLEIASPSIYDAYAEAAFNKYSRKYRDGEIPDPVTALRMAEEEANKQIEEHMLAQ